MKTILWILTTTRETPKTAEYAFRQASQRGARLDLLLVLDRKLADEAFKRLAQESFVAEGASSDLADSLIEDYKLRGQRKFDDLTRQAEREKVELAARILKGCVADECVEMIKKLNPEEIIMTRKAGSRLSRFILSNAKDKICACTECRVTIIDEAADS